MARNFFGNHVRTRAVLMVQISEISPDDPELKISAMALQGQEHFSLSERLNCCASLDYWWCLHHIQLYCKMYPLSTTQGATTRTEDG